VLLLVAIVRSGVLRWTAGVNIEREMMVHLVTAATRTLTLRHVKRLPHRSCSIADYN
jgi:hypothetical protein